MAFLKYGFRLSLICSIFLIFGGQNECSVSTVNVDFPDDNFGDFDDFEPEPDPHPFDGFSIEGYYYKNTCYYLAQTEPFYTNHIRPVLTLDGFVPTNVGPAYEVDSFGDWQAYWVNGEGMFDTNENSYWPGDRFPFEDDQGNDTSGLFFHNSSKNFYWANRKLFYEDDEFNTYYSDGSILHDWSLSRIFRTDGTEPPVAPNDPFFALETGFEYERVYLPYEVTHELEGFGLSQIELGPGGREFARFIDVEVTTHIDDFFEYSFNSVFFSENYLSNAEVFTRTASDDAFLPGETGVFQIIPLDDIDEVKMVIGTNRYQSECRIYVDLTSPNARAKSYMHLRNQSEGTTRTASFGESEQGHGVIDKKKTEVIGNTRFKGMKEEEIVEAIRSQVEERRRNSLSSKVRLKKK